jgi:hypothetical protein
MSTKPIIVVFTATGKTGGNNCSYFSHIAYTYLEGGMIDAILEDGSFTARAVTRNPESESAKGRAYLSSCRFN